MTREEAIKKLEAFAPMVVDDTREALDMAIEALSADAKPTMTEDVRDALMRLTMCAREECDMCKYKDECGFEFQYNISTENMHTILDALQAEPKHGIWTITYTDDGEGGEIPHLICSECKSEPMAWSSKRLFNYCPNCGAKMRGEE